MLTKIDLIRERITQAYRDGHRDGQDLQWGLILEYLQKRSLELATVVEVAEVTEEILLGKHQQPGCSDNVMKGRPSDG